MSRRRRELKREVLPDPKYGEVVITKFINSMTQSGKKALSEKAFYGALEDIEAKHEKNGFEVFQEAMENVRPMVEVKSQRVGGANYQVPTEVRPARRDALAIRWLVQNARSRSEKSMRVRLANELFDASQNRGNAIRKKEEAHRMAEANRAFAHYRW